MTAAPHRRRGGVTGRVAAFAVGIVLSLLAASARFGDSAHAMGILDLDGGRARHPVVLSPRHRRHTIVVTATVRPPLAGDLRVRVEGHGISAELALAEPAARLGPRPRLVGDTLVGVTPGERLALWLVLRRDGADASASARLVFSAAATDLPVLTIPVLYRAAGSH